ncbi:siroheme synthase CysG [Oryzicola mucosus]|uniref:Uroporphyrinogen-III C-methyltransferase n=1 Tax=Oryzicola mucosus TaxID=2767425 RepID=A0A8J6PTT9_9HYPH|nr:siroheme synthase CysG [Oryzicola mucosus]MBD0415379.1 uroporphyrinogen-III C-methyltransferase [Oryzicola mucosus]
MQIVSRQPNDASRRERIGKLSVLPVFFALEDKRAIVAGGSEAACWKAELLAAAGAQVHLYAQPDALSDGFAQIADRIFHHPREWTSSDLEDAAIAIADAETPAEAQAFYDAARLAGVPVNVIDKPEFCQFQFGSIVNRSPLVIGISTAGAAPILAQAVRRRIETLLPASLAGWAQLAQSMRAAVLDTLPAASSRRSFWERFVDRAFSGAPAEQVDTTLLADADRLVFEGTGTGRVTLVGAGPGDAELLTLKAVRALQAADVILFDDLVSPEVLELARREAKRLLVGKRGGRTSCRQEDINDMMVQFAKAGRRVVRLKSGDPMVFGRAGEEIARLQAENIPVDVVPGITSALAMASALGVSLTHRDCAKSVRFVTGHSRKGGLPEDLDWRAVADPSATTIFYMGGRTAGEIARRLIAHGMSGSTPVAVVSAVTRPQERRSRGTLQELEALVLAHGLDEPVLVGVGATFGGAAMATLHDGLLAASA